MHDQPAAGGDSVLVLYADSEEPSQRFSVLTEERRKRGWVTLVRLVLCPDKCVGGEVWDGDGLARCSICNGNSHVAVGVGGAYIYGSYPEPIPEEPSVIYWRNELRHYLPAQGGDQG